MLTARPGLVVMRPAAPLAVPAAAGPDVPYDLGIDLGTTFTAAAVRAEGRPGAPEPGVRVVGLEPDAVQVPSVLLVDDDGSLLVGTDAEDRAPGAPQRVVREFKRRLGDDTPIVVGGGSFSADGVAAEMVRWTADRVAETQGGGPRRVAVAHPAGWGAYRRGVFTEALAEVGLHDVVLLTEPEAAAAAHAATGRLPMGRTVAVYDLGGGTFDAAVVQGVTASPASPVGLRVLGHGQGLEALGGIDFDEALFWHVCSALGGAVDALDPADPATVRAVAGLRRACVAAKETLSVDTEAVVDVRLPGVTTRVRVTRGEFEEMISPALRQTVDVLGEVLDSARVTAGDLDGVLLVGGSSRIPLVAQMLSAELGRPVAVDPDPTTVVARGATWAAAAASGAIRPPGPRSGRFPTPGAMPLPRLGSGPFAAASRPDVAGDDEPRTEGVAPDLALLARPANSGGPVDPVTTPTPLTLLPHRPRLPEVSASHAAASPAVVQSTAGSSPAGVAGAGGPLLPPGKPDPRRRRVALGIAAAAALAVGGGVAVAVPMLQTPTSATATVAPPTPATPVSPPVPAHTSGAATPSPTTQAANPNRSNTSRRQATPLTLTLPTVAPPAPPAAPAPPAVTRPPGNQNGQSNGNGGNGNGGNGNGGNGGNGNGGNGNGNGGNGNGNGGNGNGNGGNGNGGNGNGNGGNGNGGNSGFGF